tara:strand:- start:33 stop:449 length:417 start_codon:yes stop_codon:yes gene_type:complete
MPLNVLAVLDDGDIVATDYDSTYKQPLETIRDDITASKIHIDSVTATLSHELSILQGHGYGKSIPCGRSATQHTEHHAIRLQQGEKNFEECLVLAHSRNEAFFHDSHHCITYQKHNFLKKNMHTYAPLSWIQESRSAC